MAAAENRARKQVPQEEPVKPELAAGPEPEALQPERSVSLEYLKTIVGEAVARAEEGKRKIEEVSAFIRSRVDAHRGELTAAEQAKLGAIVVEASARLRALEEKAAEVTGKPSLTPGVEVVDLGPGGAEPGEEVVPSEVVARGEGAPVTPGVRVTALPTGAVRPGEEVLETDVVAPGRPGAETEPAPSVDAAEELIRASIARMQAGEQLSDDAVREVTAYVRRFTSLPEAERNRLGALINLFKAEVRRVREEGSPVTEDQIIEAREIPLGPSPAMREAQAVLDQWGETKPTIESVVQEEAAKRSTEKVLAEWGKTGPTIESVVQEEAARAAAETARAETQPEPEVTFEEPVFEETPPAPAVPEAKAGAAPEIRVEMAPARTVRELLNIAKVRRNAEGPIRVSEIDQVRYAERRGIYENKELAGKLEAVVRAMSGQEQLKDGMSELAAIAAEVGIPAEQLQDIVDRQHAALEDRARREVQQESQAGVRKVLAKGVAYAGLGALLQRFTGAGWFMAPVRIVETWRQGKAQEAKVQARIAELEQQLASTDLSNEQATFGREVLSNVAAEIALVKQEQIDGQRDLSDTEAQEDALHHEVIRFLEETRPELSREQRYQMARAADALFTVDQASAALELRVAQQQPNVFRKLMTGMDKVFGSKWVRGGESGKERALTVGVFAAAGVLAREVPIVRNILFGYTGMKAGEFAVNMIVKRAGRYEALQPVTSEHLAAEGVTKSMIDRARAQLLDGKLRAENPAEYQKIRELLDRHEEQLYASAELATDYINERTAAMEQGLAERTKLENEKKVVVNGARVAGALLGAALGPMAVGWIAEKFRPSEAAAAPAAEGVPAPEAAGPELASTAPETDPRILELAMIRKGDGFTHVLLRQLEHKPQAFGFTGDPSNTAEVHRWAMGEAKRLAIENGFLNPDGRVTEVGLKAGSGGILLRPGGNFEIIGDPETYLVGKALGLETPTPAVGAGEAAPAVAPPPAKGSSAYPSTRTTRGHSDRVPPA